jgi:hypothetical protein
MKISIIGRVIRSLQRRPYRLRLKMLDMRGGECDYQTRTISIDPRDPEPVKILIHEVLHWLYPGRGEGWVLRTTARLYRGLKPSDEAFLWREIRKLRENYGSEDGGNE